MRSSKRIRIIATPVLIAILFVLVLTYAAKHEVLSLDWFKANKDALAAINSTCTGLIIVVTGVLAYYRFFRGRTFVVRAEPSTEVDLVVGPNDSIMHFARVSITNVGTITICA